MKYYLELKQEKSDFKELGFKEEWYTLNLNQGGVNIGGCGITTPLTENQLNAMNGLLSTLYGLNDPDFESEDDIKYWKQWASKYTEILKSRIEVENEMVKFLEE